MRLLAARPRLDRRDADRAGRPTALAAPAELAFAASSPLRSLIPAPRPTRSTSARWGHAPTFFADAWVVFDERIKVSGPAVAEDSLNVGRRRCGGAVPGWRN